MRFVLGLSVLSALVVSFQNCSQVDFQLPESSIVPLCQKLDAPEVKPKLLWDWSTEFANSPDQSFPRFNQIMSAPMVADLDGDRRPEVVFVNFSMSAEDYYSDSANSSYVRNGVLRVVEGATGKTKHSVGAQDVAPYASQAPLLMDIDGDGKVEIFYLHYTRTKLVALNHDGSKRWEYVFPGGMISFATAGVTGGDINGNFKGDIIIGKYIVSEDSQKRPQLVLTLPMTTNVHHTALALPLNPSRISEMNIVNHEGIFRADGSLVGLSSSTGNYLAAGDLNPNIAGLEVVSVGAGNLKITNGLTGDILKQVDLTQYNDLVCANRGVGGGPPSIGDFDGNKRTLEIAVATGRHLTIFDSEGQPKYKTTTQDCSSLVTGLTSFDLNGDGKPEVLYGDEEYFRIFEIVDGQLKVVHKIVNPSGTLFEYPVVADLTGTGGANIVLAANNYAAGGFYKDADELADGTEALAITGVRAFTSSGQRAWMPTRPVWNQYSFHPDLVTNMAQYLMPSAFDGGIFRRNNQGPGQNLVCR